MYLTENIIKININTINKYLQNYCLNAGHDNFLVIDKRRRLVIKNMNFG